MRIAEIVGTVTLNRCLPEFAGAQLKVVLPLSLENLQQNSPSSSDAVVVWDAWGGGAGQRIALSEGPEAAQPFRPERKPVDAYNAAILDQVNLDK